MSFTEQLELAKKQEQDEIAKAKKEKADKKKAEAEKKKRDAEKKKKAEEERIRKAKQQEDELGDPFSENVSPAEEKQNAMLDEISKAESNQNAHAPKEDDEGETKEDSKEESKPKKPKPTEHFKDADEAMDSFGKRLAEHQLAMANGENIDVEEKPKEKEVKKEKKVETKKTEANADFDEDEMKAINKIKMGGEDGSKPKSFKEYQME